MVDMLDLITRSKHRKDVLLLLAKKPMTLSEIKNSTGTSSPVILPEIRKLEEGGLIERIDGIYHLTEIGNPITLYLDRLLSIIGLIERNESFWSNHDLRGIPDDFVDRLVDLNESNIVESNPEEVFEPHKEFMSNLLKAKTIKGVSPIFHPEYPKAFLALAKAGVNTSLILNKAVLKRVSKENKKTLKKWLGFENTKLYALDEELKVAFTVTNQFISLGLFTKEGKYDTHFDLLSQSKPALKWGSDLFSYYCGRAQEVIDLDKL